MAVTVENAPWAEAAPILRRWAEDALAFLGRDDDIRIGVWGYPFTPAPDGQEASASSEGIDVHISLLPTPLDPPIKGRRLGFILYEEVAHVLLHRAGVRNEGVGEFFQELFATWAQASAAVARGIIRPHEFRTHPIDPSETRWLRYELGKHVGAALAGQRANRRHLDAWLTSGRADPTLAALVRRSLSVFNPPLTTDQIVVEYERAVAEAA